MHKINVAVSFGENFHSAGDVADLSAWPAEDIARMEQEYRLDIGAFVIERVADTPFIGKRRGVTEATPAPERTEE